MKFLVIIEGVPAPMPPEQLLAVAKANWAWAKGMVESGKAEVGYALADHVGGLMGGAGIMNVDSLEELAAILGTFPGPGGATMKVYPLVAPEVVDKLIAQAEASLAKQ